jgi:protein-histidine N-methyltransferase
MLENPDEGEEGKRTTKASKLSTMLDFIDTTSDLIPGVYEGGLKTWECSIDLACYLDEITRTESMDIRGKRILEVRCSVCR